MASSLGKAALAYADAKFGLVFPCATREKFPRVSWAEEATMNPQRIEDWWRKWPDANIGIHLSASPDTGGRMFVLDIDARSNGHHWLSTMEDPEGMRTLTGVSGSGWPSAHYWLQRTPPLHAVSASRVAEGADLKGLSRGYVVVAPSIHPSGGRYAWHDFADPRTADIAEPPTWLLSLILQNAKIRGDKLQLLDLQPHEFARGTELLDLGWPIGERVKVGMWITDCPNRAQHTGKAPRKDSSTVLEAPTRSGGKGRIRCLHAHCGEVR